MDDQVQVEPRTKVLPNGAVYDLDKKRIVANPGGGNAAFTSDTARQAQAQKQELKRARLLAGAAKTLERGGDWETPGDLDVVEALGEAVMMKALNPDSAKQVDAARFILQESGLSEAKQAETVNNTMNIIAMPEDVIHAITELRDRLQVTRTDILISDNDARSIDIVDVDSSPTGKDGDI